MTNKFTSKFTLCVLPPSYENFSKWTVQCLSGSEKFERLAVDIAGPAAAVEAVLSPYRLI